MTEQPMTTAEVNAVLDKLSEAMALFPKWQDGRTIADNVYYDRIDGIWQDMYDRMVKEA